jgi:RNA 2',3'-cyclic 3'-phosphodiesterase
MRLFLAIDLPKEIINYISPLQDSLDKASARLNIAKSYHLTIKFLGEVDENQVTSIVKSLERVKFSKFNLKTTNIGIFKNWNHINVIWIGLKESNELKQIHSDIEKSLSEFDFKSDFDFHPHITLARVSYVSYKEALKKNIESIKTEEKVFEIKEFVLYKSTLTPKGPIYTKIKEFRES